MSIKQTIQLIIKAQDEATKQVQKVENQVKKFGSSSKTAMNTVSQSTEKANDVLRLTREQTNKLKANLDKVKNGGSKAFNQLTKDEQKALVQLNMLDKSTQRLLLSTSRLNISPGLQKRIAQARREFVLLEVDTKTWAGSLNYAKTKIDLLGTSTNSLKGKLQVAGTAIQTYFSSKWDTVRPKIDIIKSKITALGSSIRNALGSAISSVSNRLQSLGQAFDGIGGMITQSLGVIGVNSLKEMTIEASISRDRIFNLSYALMGVGQSAEEFKKSSTSLWNKMDSDTNKSLVSLDQLSQALSVVKLSTGATGKELEKFEPILVDIGQRAILMGKDGEEAVGLMQAAGKGLNGEFEMLKDNLGITKDKLKENGWSGAASDVDGYTEALTKCLGESGDVSDMMNTTYGKLTSLQKFWKLAGRSLGDDFLPYIDQALDRFIKFADANKDGALDDGAKSMMKYAVGLGSVVSGFVSLAPTITPVFATFREMKGIIGDTSQAFLKLSGHLLKLGGGGLEFLGNKLQNIGPTLSSFKDKLGSVKDKLSGLGTKLVDFKGKIKNFNLTSLTQKFADLKNTIMGKFSWSNITSGLSTLKSKMLTVPFEFFKGNLSKMKVAIKDFKFSNLTTSIKNFGTTLVSVAKKVKIFSATLIAEGNIKKALAAIDIELAAAENFALGPILLIIAAVVALGVAVFELGKHFGWWKDIPSMLEAVQAGLQRLWAAFINNPDVQDFIKALGDAWNSVTSAIGPVIDAVMEFLGINTKSGEEFDIVRVIIDGVGAAFHQVANQVRFAISVFQTIYGVFQGIASFLAPYGQMIYEYLKPIVCILLGCSPGIVPALEKVQEVFQTVWSFIAGFISSYVTTVVTVITTVVTTIQAVVNVFAQLLRGQISLSEAIPMIWNLISNAFVTIGGTILTFVSAWAGQLLTLAIRAATNFMNGIINRIRALPGRVYNYITQTANRIRNGAVSWANNARNAAVNTVNAVTSNITGLPGKIYAEFVNIGSRIKEAFAHVVKQAADFANGIKNKILDILRIHSPGILQKKIGIEFEDISTKSIGAKAQMAYENAKSFASNIISGFESEDVGSLDVGTPEISGSASMAATVSSTMEGTDTTALTQGITSAYDNINNLVGMDLNQLTLMNQTSFGQISADEQNTMNSIYDHVNNSLINILKTNKTALNQNTNTTRNSLTKMNNSTKSVTKSMIKAWSTMKNSIVSAARNIKSQSEIHFNNLSRTIGSFYGKLQNPSRWGSGTGPGPVSGAGSGRSFRASRNVNGGNAMRVMSKRLASSTIRENNAPRTISVKAVQNNPFFNNIKDFVSSNGTIDLVTLLETGVLTPNSLIGLSNGSFGDWANTVKPNVDKIKNTVSKWSMKGPKIANRVSSGLTFHVSDFETGTPKIGMNDFIRMAYALINTTSYGYYADSSRYGNWLNALNHNEMNCSDGSDMLIALARTCGLPAEKVHCYWGTSSSGIAGTSKGEGHFVARIGGRIMDSVSMRHGSLTSPKVHGYGTGPAPIPRSSGTSEKNDNVGLTNPSEIKLDGDFTIKHEFSGLPDTVDEATIVRLINESTQDDAFIKGLVNNLRFQLLDQKAKVKLERKQNRSRGIGA